jgi:hypothetical protein
MKRVPGSALVMVVCLGAVLMIATTASWYTACLLHNAACVRQQVFVRQQAAQSLLIWALNQYQDCSEDLGSITKPTMVYQGLWPLTADVVCTGSVFCYPETSGIKICALLKQADQTIATAGALVVRTTTKNNLVIAQWGLDNLVC